MYKIAQMKDYTLDVIADIKLYGNTDTALGSVAMLLKGQVYDDEDNADNDGGVVAVVRPRRRRRPT